MNATPFHTPDTGDNIEIVCTRVPDNLRLGFLPRHFGRHFMLVESVIYSHMSNLCADYSGGYAKVLVMAAFRWLERSQTSAFRRRRPITLTGWLLSPMSAALATSLSSASVITYALRLRYATRSASGAPSLWAKLNVQRSLNVDYRPRPALLND